MLNSSEVFLNFCSNEDSFSWPSDERMIYWLLSEVQFAWWNCGYQVHLLANKQAPQKLMHFLLLLWEQVSHFLYDALLTQSPWFFWLSYELSCRNIQNMQEHSKHAGTFFQILYAFQPFSLKSFSVTAFCLSVKTILLCLSELENCESSKQRPVISTDFDLHCNGFLHCQDFFARQRRKKTN